MNKVAIIDGVRIPFLQAGTGYKNAHAYELAKLALLGLLQKTNISTQLIENVILGTVVHNIKTSNVARESALAAGLSVNTPCDTVSMACISANRAIANAYQKIATAEAEVIIAGGTDSVSDTPIGYNKAMRQKLFEARKLKKTTDYLKFATTLRPHDFFPEVPQIKEFSTGRTMGQDCDIMADRFGITRSQQDEYALLSHQKATQAQANGWLQLELVPAELPPNFIPILHDNGIRNNMDYAKISTLKSAFTPPHGTITAANASFLTDGAALTLLMSQQKAQTLGYKPKAYIKDYVFVAQNPADELLLGPAYAVAKLLQKTGLQLSNIDVFELHEAFAGQVLANLKCLNSDAFAKEKLNLTQKIGEIDPYKLNNWGGSLAIGHPFGATGARLVNTATNRLEVENGELALIAACAAGGHGHAMIIQRA